MLGSGWRLRQRGGGGGWGLVGWEERHVRQLYVAWTIIKVVMSRNVNAASL